MYLHIHFVEHYDLYIGSDSLNVYWYFQPYKVATIPTVTSRYFLILPEMSNEKALRDVTTKYKNIY